VGKSKWNIPSVHVEKSKYRWECPSREIQVEVGKLLRRIQSLEGEVSVENFNSNSEIPSLSETKIQGKNSKPK
jgi:hypothetical protein